MMMTSPDTSTRPARDPNDYGPCEARGLRVLEDGADPEDPNRTTRRARVSCLYDTAWRKGHLTADERNACDRYAALVEAAGGACEDRGEYVGDRPAPHLRDGGMLTRVAAQAIVTDAEAAVGICGKRMLRGFVLANLPAEQIALSEGVNRHIAAGLVLAAVRRLTEHWDKSAPDQKKHSPEK